MKKLLNLFSALVCVIILPLSAQDAAQPVEKIKEWRWWNADSLKAVQFVSPADHAFQAKVTSAEKTPDGHYTLQCLMVTAKANPAPHERQINFRWTGALEKARTYRIEFWIKGTAPGEISLLVAQGLPPFKAIGDAAQTIQVTTEWKKVTVDFHLYQNWDEDVSVPRLLLTNYPLNETFYLGTVRFSSLKN